MIIKFSFKPSLSLTHTHTHTRKDALFSLVPPAGEPSPPAVHGQRGMGKAYRLGLVKQDDGGMPIVEYIVKYKPVSMSNTAASIQPARLPV